MLWESPWDFCVYSVLKYHLESALDALRRYDFVLTLNYYLRISSLLQHIIIPVTGEEKDYSHNNVVDRVTGTVLCRRTVQALLRAMWGDAEGADETDRCR